MFRHPGVDVRQRQVGYHALVRTLEYSHYASRGGCNRMGMQESDAFGWTRGAGGVVYGDNVCGLRWVIGWSPVGCSNLLYLLD